MRTTLAFVLVAGLAASAAQAADVTVSLFGVYAPTTISYDSVHNFTAFAEPASLTAAYEAQGGFGFEAGVVWNFTRSLGVGVAGGLVTRSVDTQYDARIPHPLFLRRDRQAEGAPDDLDYQEGQVHLDLVYTGRSGSFDFSVFGGPSFLSVTADILGEPQFQQDYPFNTISISSVPKISHDDSGFGFNVGAGAAYRFNDRIGFGLQGRFTRASIELEPPDQETVEIDAGGFQIAGGLRIYF
jgi:opacity protein-like surface antigen